MVELVMVELARHWAELSSQLVDWVVEDSRLVECLSGADLGHD